MCNQLSEREAQIHELQKKGKTPDQISKETGLAVSSVRTYICRIKKKVQDTVKNPKKTKKSSKIKEFVKSVVADAVKTAVTSAILKRCNSFGEFTSMMEKVPVRGKSLVDRVEEFKDVYCKVCIYPTRCKECPTKVLMDKYLF